ncbi:hypothetical protein [Roseomonas indoligenes]|uniref:Uncharacterized protein n=1 Tax=Roseomonas indoligenes TaxID=2820811 RepID=A0A940S5B3_9PROT|nr:hypothetical protein [Pararoseomonas indoligenes]MBP0492839.1 hypothetical protein [Pararoseomonas indoligenes]
MKLSEDVMDKQVDDSAIAELPPLVDRVLSSRVQSGLFVIQKIISDFGPKLTTQVFADANHLCFSVFPTHEKTHYMLRLGKFGTPFPGLYSVAGRPIGLLEHVGAVNIPAADLTSTVLGAAAGGSVLQGECAFNLAKGASLNVVNVTVRSPRGSRFRYDYRVFLTFLLSFGERTNRFNVVERIEDQVSRYFVEQTVARGEV